MKFKSKYGTLTIIFLVSCQVGIRIYDLQEYIGREQLSPPTEFEIRMQTSLSLHDVTIYQVIIQDTHYCDKFGDVVSELRIYNNEY